MTLMMSEAMVQLPPPAINIISSVVTAAGFYAIIENLLCPTYPTILQKLQPHQFKIKRI
jgi:hypothetical protein